MKISITIDRATVSTTVDTPEEFWSMTIPCMMAAGYTYDTAFRSLEDFFEGEKQAYVDLVGEPAETYDEEDEDEPETEHPDYIRGYADAAGGLGIDIDSCHSQEYSRGYYDGCEAADKVENE